MYTGLRCLYGIALVVNRRGGAGKVVDLIDLDIQRERDVMANQFESLVTKQMFDISARATKEIIDTYDIGPFVEQSIAKMRAKESGPARNQYSLFKMH